MRNSEQQKKRATLELQLQKKYKKIYNLEIFANIHHHPSASKFYYTITFMLIYAQMCAVFVRRLCQLFSRNLNNSKWFWAFLSRIPLKLVRLGLARFFKVRIAQKCGNCGGTKICDPNAEFECNDFSIPLETLPELVGVCPR